MSEPHRIVISPEELKWALLCATAITGLVLNKLQNGDDVLTEFSINDEVDRLVEICFKGKMKI